MTMHRSAILLACAVLLGAAEAEPRPLTLRETVALSASTVPVSLATLDEAIARAGLSAERRSLMPKVEATTGVVRQRLYPLFDDGSEVAPTTDLSAQVRVGIALLDLQAWHATAAAKRQLAASEAATTVAIEQAALAGALAYLDLTAAQSRIEVLREDLRLAEELLILARARVAIGSSEPITETRAESHVASARSALAIAEGQARSASIVLARSLDLDPGSPLVASDALGVDLVGMVPLTDPVAIEAFALEHRTELRVADQQLAAFEEAARAARGASWPRLDAFAEAGAGGPDTDTIDPGWKVGLGLTIPILDEGSPRIEQLRLRAKQEALRRVQSEDRIRAQVRQALAGLETAQARLLADRARQGLAGSELAQARTRFEAGVAGNLEMIDAQRGKTAAEVALVASVESLIGARIRLVAAMGSLGSLR